MYYYQNKKYQLIKELQVLFEEVPFLVNKYESRDSDFVLVVKQWLSKGEDLLTRNRRPEVSELASLRGIITAADRGIIDPSFSIDSKLRKGKAASAITLFSLNKAQGILQSVLGVSIEDVKEAEMLIKQIIALAGQKGLLGEYFKKPKTNKQNLRSLWTILSKTEDIRVGMNRILSLIPFDDVLVLTETILAGWPSFLLRTNAKKAGQTKEDL